MHTHKDTDDPLQIGEFGNDEYTQIKFSREQRSKLDGTIGIGKNEWPEHLKVMYLVRERASGCYVPLRNKHELTYQSKEIDEKKERIRKKKRKTRNAVILAVQEIANEGCYEG